MKKIFIPLLLLTAVILSVVTYTRDVMNDLDSSLIRLHIIAESDSEYDQNVKLAVRDEILRSVRNISARDTELFTRTAEAAANSYLSQCGLPYGARAEYGKFSFPRKSYKNITLPAGEYCGVRVVLGSGGGHNWWCVMYPPLCVSDDGNVYADEKTSSELKGALRSDTYELITEKSEKTEIKFRILEFINSLK
ncbi:MAG: stage II sporulation protein R [Candidatus Ornithomonoglobus sp.]